MLVLTRNKGQRVLVETSDGPVWIEVVEVHGKKVRLGFIADAAVKITREENLPQQPVQEAK